MLVGSKGKRLPDEELAAQQQIKAMTFKVLGGNAGGGSKTTTSMHHRGGIKDGVTYHAHLNHRNRPDVINNIYNPHNVIIGGNQGSTLKKDHRKKSKSKRGTIGSSNVGNPLQQSSNPLLSSEQTNLSS
jgi:hypothetical protein